MKYGKFSLLFSSMLSSILVGASAQAWGPVGHEVVSYVGSSLSTGEAQPFFVANADGMRTLSTVPDRVWKGPKTKSAESLTHWFQADAYIKDINQCTDIYKFPKSYDAAVNQYGLKVIETNGTAPWRIIQFYNLALADLKSGDMKSALENVGAMSHYIGDLSMPLHVSENYNGQLTGNGGIHAWFESQNIGDEQTARAEVKRRAQALLQDPAYLAEFKGDLFDVITHEIVRSLLKRDEVLNNDTKLGRTSAEAKKVQFNLAADRMADGAATLSLIITQLWKDSGLRSNATPTPINDPQWVAPDYSHQFSALLANDKVDDCNEQ